ncbi:MAG: hypothetical protein Q7T18_02390 [Sedimentisphaerales bacterium]|nr:hypothetical protein [Sedimentisphaerales bacterium]
MKNILKHYTQPAFLICVAILLVAAGGMSATVSYLGLQFIKKPLPLKKTFDKINEVAMSPWKVVEKSKIKNKDILESLGTDDYIQWIFEDTTAEPSSPVRYCSLFITYYTGNPDQVPHVPEECYLGGGKILTELPKELNFSVPINGKSQKVSARWLSIGNKSGDVLQGDSTFGVLYFFKVNGVYAGNRDATRRVMQTNFFSKYSYFSKVEWFFFNRSGTGSSYPTKEQAAVASQKFLVILVPILENDHWPDWEKAQNKK